MTFDLHRHRGILYCSPLYGMFAFSLQMKSTATAPISLCKN
nr:MAG TPA_asm: hypothetical protein [Caudoviricetes sp.]